MHDEIVDRMTSYADAWRSLDAEGLTSFYVDDPAFRVYNDGQVFTREQLVDAITQLCSSAQSFDARWRDLEVTPLGADAALAASRFTRVIVDEAGEATRDWGTVTWVWTRRGDDWKIIHGHGVHYPGELPPR